MMVPEPNDDAFEREPYVVHFSATQHDYDFTLVGIHTSPKHAFDEIDALFPVYEDAIAKLGDEDIILLGDLNASCNYVRQSRIDNLVLRQDDQVSPGTSTITPIQRPVIRSVRTTVSSPVELSLNASITMQHRYFTLTKRTAWTNRRLSRSPTITRSSYAFSWRPNN